MPLAARLGFASPPAFCIDGSAFIYRGFHALPELKRADGHPTNALFIIMRLLVQLLKEEKPRHLVFFMDGKGPTFRDEAYALYKAQRPATPEDLLAQMDPIRQGLGLLGVPVHTSQGCEADDCIASYVEQAKAGGPVVIVGSDKDLRQLLAPEVVLWDPMAKPEKCVTLEAFVQETGVSPSQWPDVQALVGDSADNIPGVPGVGPKTALALFQQYPDLETLRDHVAALKPALRAKLEPHLEQMFLWRTLTTLRRHDCLPGSWEDYRVSPPDRPALLQFLRDWELRSLLREVEQAWPATGSARASVPGQSAQSGQSGQPSPSGPSGLAVSGSLLDLAAAPAPTRPETDQLPDLAGRTVGLHPALAAGQSEEGWSLWVEGVACRQAALPVAALATAARIHAVDVKGLLRRHAELAAVPVSAWFDVGLAAWLLSPEERDYGLPRLMDRLAAELPGPPPGLPAAQCAALGDLLARRLADAGMTPLFADLESPLMPVLAAMERRGVAIDRAAFAVFLRDVVHQLDEGERALHALAGRPFNVRSSQQLADILFTDLGLSPGGKTPKGAASTSQDVLEKMADKHPLVRAILDYRVLEKLRSTYLEPLPRLAGEEGVIRTTFNQLATATGRLSSLNPNLQNIPIRGPQGTRMRACFVAKPDHWLVAADYSQIELRVLAHMSQDPTLLEAFRLGADIHARTAALLFDTSPDAVTPDQRRNAKTINFGLVYGMGPQKLAQELAISLKEAKAFIARYFERLQRLKAFYDEVEAGARERGYVTTLCHRRRLLPHIHSRNEQLRSQARRQAVNTVIQGSAADVIKLAMLSVAGDGALRDLGASLLLQVHDELVLEVPGDESTARKAGEKVSALMAGVLDAHPLGVSPLAVPLVADWGVGRNWGEAH